MTGGWGGGLDGQNDMAFFLHMYLKFSVQGENYKKCRGPGGERKE